MSRHLSFIESLAAITPTKQIRLRSWQDNPEKGMTLWVPGRNGPEKMLWEPEFRLCFEAYNRGEIFQKEWQCEEYMKARYELAMKYQMKYYGRTIQQDLFGNIDSLELVPKETKEIIKEAQLKYGKQK